MRLSQNRQSISFGKKFLGFRLKKLFAFSKRLQSFFGNAVDIDIHKELKNELNTQICDLQLPTNEKNKFVVKFEAKDRFCDSLTMKITEVLIASGNKGKLVEIADLLAKINIKVISAADFNLSEPEETGSNFEENAIIKAKYYGDKTGFVAISDDSGLCIDFLGGKPGIHSARWAIDDKNGEKNFELAFERIRQELIANNVNVKNQKITAHFICNLTLYCPQTKQIQSFEGRVDGSISLPPRGQNGFGYDPIFIADGYEKTFGEMLPKHKDAISHRNEAFKKLVAQINPSNY